MEVAEDADGGFCGIVTLAWLWLFRTCGRTTTRTEVPGVLRH